MENTIYKQIGDTAYMVNIFGEVYSTKRNKIRKMKVNLHPEGYLQIILMIEKQRKAFLIHRLVAEAFIENTENKPYINHKDCNKMNNNIDNLEWCSGKENAKHASLMGRLKPQIGEKNGNSKLKKSDVIEIRQSTLPNKDIAKKYGVSASNISYIKRGMLWNKI